MFFLTFSNANIWIAEKNLVSRSYIIEKPCFLVATSKVEFIDNKKFAAEAVAQEVISYMTSHAFLNLISLIFLYPILRLSFLSGEQLV